MSEIPSMERDKPHEEAQQEALEKQQAREHKKAIFGEDPLKEPETPEIQEPQCEPHEVDKLCKRALELPHEIYAYEMKLISCHNKDDYINKRSQEIRDRTYLNVSNERTEGAQKYPDRQSQEKEATKRLQESKTWEKAYARIYGEVTDEVDEEGKKKFKNETSRKAETTHRIYEDSEVKQLNARLLEKVCQECEEGKLAYTNEKQREIEVQNRLNNHAEYQLLMKEQKENVNLTHQTKSEVYLKRGEAKAIETITELMKVKLRIA